VNAVTRSGANTVHGSAFEYVRNQAVNASNFFSPIVNGKKQQDGLKRNQYGGTLGGPVWLPKIYNGRDKTFFFFSYQGCVCARRPYKLRSSSHRGHAAGRSFFPAPRPPVTEPLNRPALPGQSDSQFRHQPDQPADPDPHPAPYLGKHDLRCGA